MFSSLRLSIRLNRLDHRIRLCMGAAQTEAIEELLALDEPKADTLLDTLLADTSLRLVPDCLVQLFNHHRKAVRNAAYIKYMTMVDKSLVVNNLLQLLESNTTHEQIQNWVVDCLISLLREHNAISFDMVASLMKSMHRPRGAKDRLYRIFIGWLRDANTREAIALLVSEYSEDKADYYLHKDLFDSLVALKHPICMAELISIQMDLQDKYSSVKNWRRNVKLTFASDVDEYIRGYNTMSSILSNHYSDLPTSILQQLSTLPDSAEFKWEYIPEDWKESSQHGVRVIDYRGIQTLAARELRRRV